MPFLLPALVLALTPLLWRQASVAPVSLAPVPLLMVWLLAVSSFSTTNRAIWAVIGGVALGAGVYLSPAAAVMMPIFAAVTIGAVAEARALSTRDLGLFTAGFAIVALPFIAALAIHPEDYRQLIQSHHLYDAERFNILQGAREITSWVGLTARTEVYWDYLNPAFLFITGRVLAWPLALFLVIGVYRIVVGDSTLIDRVSLLGLLASPVAASLTAEPPTPARIVWITPFAAMVSSHGILWLVAWWRSSVAAAR